MQNYGTEGFQNSNIQVEKSILGVAQHAADDTPETSVWLASRNFCWQFSSCVPSQTMYSWTPW